MRKGTGEFRKVEVTKVVCDECRDEIDILNQITYDSHWSDGYDVFGEDYDFCSVQCMLNHSEKYRMMFPPDNEDVKLEIPAKFMKIIMEKLK